MNWEPVQLSLPNPEFRPITSSGSQEAAHARWAPVDLRSSSPQPHCAASLPPKGFLLLSPIHVLHRRGMRRENGAPNPLLRPGNLSRQLCARIGRHSAESILAFTGNGRGFGAPVSMFVLLAVEPSFLPQYRVPVPVYNLSPIQLVTCASSAAASSGASVATVVQPTTENGAVSRPALTDRARNPAAGLSTE